MLLHGINSFALTIDLEHNQLQGEDISLNKEIVDCKNSSQLIIENVKHHRLEMQLVEMALDYLLATDSKTV